MQDSLIIAMIVVIAVIIIYNIYKYVMMRKLMNTLSKGEVEKYFKILHFPLVRYAYPVVTSINMELNGYIVSGNHEKIKESLLALVKVRKNKKQTYDAYLKAFNYFVQMDEKEDAKMVLEKIEKTFDEKTILSCQRMYDIQLMKKSNHIDEMIKEIKEAEGIQKGILEYMVAIQYENSGDKKKQLEFLQEAKKHVKGTAYEKIAEDEIKNLGK